MEVHSVAWLSDTGAPFNGQGGSAGKGTEDFHSAQSPPTSSAYFVEAMGNTARNRDSLSCNHETQFTVCVPFIMHIIY